MVYHCVYRCIFEPKGAIQIRYYYYYFLCFFFFYYYYYNYKLLDDQYILFISAVGCVVNDAVSTQW